MPEKKITITVHDDEPVDEAPAKRAEGWFLLALLAIGAIGWLAQHIF